MARGLSDLQKWILATLANRRGRKRPLLFSEIKQGFPPYAGRADDPAVAVIISKALTRLERRGLVQVAYFNVSGTLMPRRDGNRLGRWKPGRPLPRLKGRRAGHWVAIVPFGAVGTREVRDAAKGSAQLELPFSQKISEWKL